MFKLRKALYGLKQAPTTWFDLLSTFLMSNGLSMSKVDNTLFRKMTQYDFILVPLYVDDVIFGATNESLCKEFSKLMQSELEMSITGELNFFLGSQIR